jgi:serine protease AprX
MSLPDQYAGGRKLSLILLMLFSSLTLLRGQDDYYPYFYRISFRDKGDYTASEYSPDELLSPRAVERRKKSGIKVPDFYDLPVYREYLKQITTMGLKLHCTSKWMNSALFKSTGPADMTILSELPFVRDVKPVKTPGYKSYHTDKLAINTSGYSSSPSDLPVSMINGTLIHSSGYYGNNILIAVLDGGFLFADKASSLDNLWNDGGIIFEYDFVTNQTDVFNSSQHGTAVLSVLAGDIPGTIEGTAPAADYMLFKTEDVATEFPCEEDFWVAAAEFADSSGADIITSSLGYFTFDDPTMNYKTSDLDGKTAFITRAAGIAASKGILVVNSAGNERNKTWKYIIFPSDGDSVLTAGAVDENKIISAFSSAGPTTDKRIKPDIVALGVNVPLQMSATSVTQASGTSFSCPILSGMAACLMQAVPEANANDIIQSLRITADRSEYPDSLYGFGIPDFLQALSFLQDKYARDPDEGFIVAPNPTHGDIRIIFSGAPSLFNIEIISMTGKIIFRKNFSDYAGRIFHLNALQNNAPGVYIVRVTTTSEVFVKKVIKLRN